MPLELSREDLPAALNRVDILRLFEQHNPELNVDAIALRCSRQRLDEIEICLDGRMQFSQFPVSADTSCGGDVRLRANCTTKR